MKQINKPERPFLPHEQRVVNEYTDLQQRQNKLDKFIVANPIFLTLPEEEQDLLREQQHAMLLYKYILGQRINAFCKIA